MRILLEAMGGNGIRIAEVGCEDKGMPRVCGRGSSDAGTLEDLARRTAQCRPLAGQIDPPHGAVPQPWAAMAH